MHSNKWATLKAYTLIYLGDFKINLYQTDIIKTNNDRLEDPKVRENNNRLADTPPASHT